MEKKIGMKTIFCTGRKKKQLYTYTKMRKNYGMSTEVCTDNETIWSLTYVFTSFARFIIEFLFDV